MDHQFLMAPPVPLPAFTAQFDACGERAEPLDLYDALQARLKREHVPFTVQWELTHVCNLDCVMCYNVPQPEPELNTQECLDILEQLAAAGALRLMLTGGEILARRDFFTIAERARALGFALDLKTNGTLITPERADQLAALHPIQVDISLLGATPETSDAVMRGKNTLDRILRGVRLLQERGVRVKLNSLLLDLNIAEREQMIALALDLGVRYEQVFKVSPADDGTLAEAADGRQLSRAQMTHTLVADASPFTPRVPVATTRTCSVGLSSCLISPYGVVYPCIELRIPAGRLAGVPPAALRRDLGRRADLPPVAVSAHLQQPARMPRLPHQRLLRGALLRVGVEGSRRPLRRPLAGVPARAGPLRPAAPRRADPGDAAAGPAGRPAGREPGRARPAHPTVGLTRRAGARVSRKS